MYMFIFYTFLIWFWNLYLLFILMNYAKCLVSLVVSMWYFGVTLENGGRTHYFNLVEGCDETLSSAFIVLGAYSAVAGSESDATPWFHIIYRTIRPPSDLLWVELFLVNILSSIHPITFILLWIVICVCICTYNCICIFYDRLYFSLPCDISIYIIIYASQCYPLMIMIIWFACMVEPLPISLSNSPLEALMSSLKWYMTLFSHCYISYTITPMP